MPITKGSFSGSGNIEERGLPVPHPSDVRDMAPDDDSDDNRAGKKTVTMKKAGKPTITFQKGGLHQSLGVPQDEPIPAGKMAAAKAGKYGPKAAKQANFAANVLAKGQKTAAKGGK